MDVFFYYMVPTVVALTKNILLTMCAKLQTLSSSLLSLAGIVLANSGPAFREKCLAFKPDHYVGNSTLNVLEYITAGTNLTLGDNAATCNRASQIVSVDICRIALAISTSEISQITFEAWFPEDWSGRFLATGNGGIDGCIKYEDLDYGSQNGFATVGANNGHNGTTGEAFLNNHETVVDFAWRSVEAGKTLIPHFYQSLHHKSYYMGCSLGGRQGIKAAELFPEDFDGILAGAPGVDFNNLVSWRARFFTITGPATSPDFIPVSAWKTWIHDEVLRQCDSLDGVKDGIIEDPSLCHFNPWTLHCNASSAAATTTTTASENCLSDNQVHQLIQIFTPYTYPSGNLIYPAMQPGSEQQATEKLYAGAPFAYSADWFKYVVYANSTSWDPSRFNLSDARRAEALNPANIRTYPSSLPGFEARGGKILMYHGQQDNQVTCFNSNRFYEHLRGGTRSYESMNTWLRFFRISGMFHCSGGPGAWVLGQGGNAARKGIAFQRRYNLLAALVAWVEEGEAPEAVEGTKFVDDKVEKGVLFRRRHCLYPKRNRFEGGDDKQPGSWVCR